MDKIIYVKNNEDKTHDCGDCKYFYSNGFMSPGGQCELYPEYNKIICMDYKNFPEYATICEDFQSDNKH